MGNGGGLSMGGCLALGKVWFKFVVGGEALGCLLLHFFLAVGIDGCMILLDKEMSSIPLVFNDNSGGQLLSK
jgi:hypothetical protein